jgi:4-amino-4-deoxy-L-arabinose transferase-like glycosyltransferase
MLKRSRVELLLLVVATAVTRYAFRSHFLYDLDSLGFALGVQHFDPRVYQPHPPGYFLYVCLGKLFHALTPDVNLALVLLSIVASCGAAALIYRMAEEWFGVQAARFAGLIFLFSPLAWFHGIVALTYIVEAFFSALVGYMCWKIDCGDRRIAVPAGIVLGISAGVRPSSLILLGPLFLFSLRQAGWKRAVAAISGLLMVLLAWFLPMIFASRGFGAYFGALFSLWRMVPSRDTVFNSNPATSIARALTIVFILVLCFGSALLVLLWRGRSRLPAEPQKRRFTLLWVGPALCFFTFIFLKFVNSGYLLLLVAPLSIWLGAWAAGWYGQSAWPRPWKLAIVGVGAVANCVLFLASPLYCSYRQVRRHELEIDSVRTALPQMASPGDTLIVGFDSHFLGYRDAGYYLPGYLSIEYPAVKLIEGTRVFAMEHGQTRLLTALPAGSYSRFVLFPLPTGERANQIYLSKVKALLPSKDLRSISLGGHDFVTAPLTDLPLLYPSMAHRAASGVSNVRQSSKLPVNSRVHQPWTTSARR